MEKKKDRTLILIVAALILCSFLGFLLVVWGLMKVSPTFTGLGDKVAIIEITGPIHTSADAVKQLKKYRDDGSVKAVVLRINSPGGGVAASQEIYEQVLKFKEAGKYVVTSMASVCASGGYLVACASDTIIANPGTLTGSIGVILSYPIFEELMGKVGIKIEVIKSGEMKDVGSSARELTYREREMLEGVIFDSYDQFVKIVTDNRDLDREYVESLADGSLFTGRQAIEHGLIDRLGTLEDAVTVAGIMSDLGESPKIIREKRFKGYWWEILFEVLGIEGDLPNLKIGWPTIEYRLAL